MAIKKVSKPFVCNECGKLLTLAQAEKAMRSGCSCGGYDIDVNPN